MNRVIVNGHEITIIDRRKSWFRKAVRANSINDSFYHIKTVVHDFGGDISYSSLTQFCYPEIMDKIPSYYKRGNDITEIK